MNHVSGVSSHKYVIISPVRDEERYIERTLKSIIHQTIRPTEWVLVDDGSHDATGAIIDQYARNNPWIACFHRPDRGQRVPGSGVMEAFYHGYDRLQSNDWQFIVKLDGDVGLDPDYFELCFDRFRQDPGLGMCGGTLYRINGDRLTPEQHPSFHVRGPIKLYRRACWESIGGLLRAPGWDTADELKANMLGWHTRTFSDVKAIHYRPTGAEQGPWRDGMKNGKADYITGYHPLFMALKCTKRFFQKPYGIDAVAHAYGFVRAYWERVPQVKDRDLIRYTRSQQLRRVLFMESIWK